MNKYEKWLLKMVEQELPRSATKSEVIEWLAEKATEIGLDAITFLNCRFSERKVVKAERVERIVVSAKAMQCIALPITLVRAMRWCATISITNQVGVNKPEKRIRNNER